MTMKERHEIAEDKHRAMRAYCAEGHTSKEVAQQYGVTINYAKQICRGVKRDTLGHKGHEYRNQYTSNSYDQIGNFKRHLERANPDMEYVCGFVNSNAGKVTLMHKLCGTEFDRSVITIRKEHKTICPYCLQIKPKKTKRLSAEEKERRKAERHEIALANRPMVLARAKAKQLEATRKRQEARRHDCPVCGTSTTRRKYCSDACLHKAMDATKEASRRIKIERNLVDKDITLRRLFARDNGVCWICGMVCDYHDKTYRGRTMIAGDMYPSIDHVVALSDGGAHAWSNVKLAHRICNSLRYYSPQPKLEI